MDVNVNSGQISEL